eukprot:15606255-Heterocapsa_arctica.AAC.1
MALAAGIHLDAQGLPPPAQEMEYRAMVEAARALRCDPQLRSALAQAREVNSARVSEIQGCAQAVRASAATPGIGLPPSLPAEVPQQSDPVPSASATSISGTARMQADEPVVADAQQGIIGQQTRPKPVEEVLAGQSTSPGIQAAGSPCEQPCNTPPLDE